MPANLSGSAEQLLAARTVLEESAAGRRSCSRPDQAF
jgi:hypothetical protein